MPKPTESFTPSPTPSPDRPATLAALTGRDRHFLAGRWFSLQAALHGVWHTLSTQPNAWIELAAVAMVSITGWWLQISAIEWALFALVFSLVLALEAVNTALEATVDLVAPHYHPLAKIAKDAAAGGLVFAVLGSLGVATAILASALASAFLKIGALGLLKSSNLSLSQSPQTITNAAVTVPIVNRSGWRERIDLVTPTGPAEKLAYQFNIMCLLLGHPFASFFIDSPTESQ